jgi:hypothetical protein
VKPVNKKKGEVWETQAQDHEGHIRTIVDQTAQYQIIKCNCGDTWRVDK